MRQLQGQLNNSLLIQIEFTEHVGLKPVYFLISTVYFPFSLADEQLFSFRSHVLAGIPVELPFQ